MFWLLLLFAITGCVVPVVAHAPYEVEAGSFQRGDGKTISITEYYRDGIMGRDYVIHQFRGEDGGLIATTQVSRAKVITRARPRAAEIYYYPGAWMPIATNITRFDGYSFSDMRTSGAEWFSLLLHTWRVKGQYLLSLTVAAILVLLWRFLKSLPSNRGFLRVAVALVFVPLSLLWVMFLFFAPISPFIVFGCLAVSYGICVGVRNFLRARDGNPALKWPAEG